MYILIFTCLNTRAVHLDLIPDMSTHSFVSALLRFSNKFGIPSHIYSDNARSFLKGCDVISEVFSCSQFLEHFQTYNIKHVTIPVYSPWVGSTWERLIRVVKNCIRKTVGRAKIEYFDMLTLLCDVENAVNSRPLTYQTSESDLEVITPNSFIYPNSNTNLFLRIEGENPTLSEPPSQSLLLQSLSNRNHLLKTSMNCGTMLTCCPLEKVLKIVMSIDLKIRLMLMTSFSYVTHKSPDHFDCWVELLKSSRVMIIK